MIQTMIRRLRLPEVDRAQGVIAPIHLPLILLHPELTTDTINPTDRPPSRSIVACRPVIYDNLVLSLAGEHKLKDDDRPAQE